jgi:hypothetical protein
MAFARFTRSYATTFFREQPYQRANLKAEFSCVSNFVSQAIRQRRPRLTKDNTGCGWSRAAIRPIHYPCADLPYVRFLISSRRNKGRYLREEKSPAEEIWPPSLLRALSPTQRRRRGDRGGAKAFGVRGCLSILRVLRLRTAVSTITSRAPSGHCDASPCVWDWSSVNPESFWGE